MSIRSTLLLFKVLLRSSPTWSGYKGNTLEKVELVLYKSFALLSNGKDFECNVCGREVQWED